MGIATSRVTELGAQDEKKLRRELERVEERLQRFFPRREMKEAAVGYLEGLLSAVERKNSWQMSEAQGHPSPYRFQHLLDRANWDADAVRDDHLQHVATEWGKGPSEPYGVLVLDETGFLKKGEKSAGVARQYSGTAGRIENCQIGVFLSYVTPKGRLLLDRELYLPQAWVKDKERCLEADIPEDRIELHTKGALGLKMLKRAVTVGIRPEWVTGDEVYGKDYHLRRWLEESAIPYVLAVASNTYVWRNFERKTVNSLLAELQPSDWKRLSCGTGAKGPRLYDWALLPINSFDLPDKQARAVLFRGNISNPTDIAFYRVACDPKISLEEILRVAGSRWTIEECFEAAKGDVGLDQYEVRSWQGWYRHITLAMLAHALLAETCCHFMLPKKKRRPGMVEFLRSRGLMPWSH